MEWEDLLRKIEELPKFELRDLAVREGEKYIECRNRKAVIESGKPHMIIATVSERYNLVQFRDIFIPVIEKIRNIEDGVALNWFGKGYLEIYPRGEEFKLNGGRIGLVVRNSVDKGWAVRIDFIINMDGLKFIPPRRIVRGLRKVHRGQIQVAVENYLKVISEVKEAWKSIVSDFQKYILKDIEDFAKETKIGKRIKKKLLRIAEEEPLSLWDAFVITIDEISKRRFKSEISRMEKIERVTNAIFKYALTLSI